jgi:hypothetical protein
MVKAWSISMGHENPFHKHCAAIINPPPCGHDAIQLAAMLSVQRDNVRALDF